MYALAKFQPDMPITFQGMVLQISNSKMIDLYSSVILMARYISNAMMPLFL